MDEATVMTTGTSVTTATAVTTGSAITSGTGVLSQDTIDRKQFTRQGGNNQSTTQRKVVAPESHITRAEPNSVVFPGWASALDAAADQAVIINPVLLYRDSNPLRSVSLRPTASKVVVSRDGGLEDSLSLNPATTGENITLAVGSNAKSITIVDMTRPFNAISIRHELQGVHRGSIYTSDWSRDGQLLASGSNDKTIRVIRFV
jgi:WD40 repeat protein